MRNPSDHFLQIINADFDVVKTTLKGLQVGVSYIRTQIFEQDAYVLPVVIHLKTREIDLQSTC